MGRRRLVVTPGTVALLLVAGSAWAGPPPPPPSDAGDERASSAPPPPSSSRIETTPADPLVVDQRTADTDLTTNWTYSRGGTRGPNYVRQADDDPFFTVNPIGYYQGVSIAGGNSPPFAPKEIGGASAVLTWTGFERGESSSRVFFQLSTSVEPEISVEGTRVFVKLPRTSVKIRNNRRKLITKFFKTPVNEVKVSRTGKDVLAVLELRWEATPSWRFEAGAHGYQVLVLEFSDTQDQDQGTQGGTPPAPTPPPTSQDPGDSDDSSTDPSPFLPS
ncbi:hypothetical protein ENSA5_51780 [Enhygromyxa salina]|uniref:Uncharacterized protein n=1 Tax=Enhygromyxa salina TaxID=215803 RepID=A0A2S9XGL1_9BACT|nr:hypothetical protein [Enhygromyxa salina]PRP91967.1 hypothetical protein ENSA5_51780 [Enhygromyxa salina]